MYLKTFAELLTKLSMNSKQNQKSEGEPDLRKRHAASKEGPQAAQTNNDFTKDQTDAVKKYTFHSLIFNFRTFFFKEEKKR